MVEASIDEVCAVADAEDRAASSWRPEKKLAGKPGPKWKAQRNESQKPRPKPVKEKEREGERGEMDGKGGNLFLDPRPHTLRQTHTHTEAYTRGFHEAANSSGNTAKLLLLLLQPDSQQQKADVQETRQCTSLDS